MVNSNVPYPSRREVKIDEMKAKYQNGILEITAPIDRHYLPRKIEVEVQNN
jgi:HSP20 family molecular chaperone IbpA